jgi:phosphoribosylglycinamide formyltransferase-1
MKKIILFASGSGTNAEKIIQYGSAKSTFKVMCVFCNNSKAKVLERALHNNVPAVLFSKDDLNSGVLISKLRSMNPDLIVLAGFLLQLPAALIEAFPNKIVNIHPALLPKYGGKGMYGKHVHEAVLNNKEIETGITIHFVNEFYDKGELIFQKSVAVDDCATAEEIAIKVHALEHEFYPKVIEQVLIN